ncbi:MAG: arsenate reductase ArsC [Candidatus Bathyarchaeota archaeon]|nr:arsenate reductase ArsC [Candidatus Bathyarchaeota archaeon]
MKTVLFVCVHNAARSQMAEAFFNVMAGGRHVGISAGSQPAERVNPRAVEAMGELRIDISGARPKRLTADMIERADLVVTMGCGENVCPIVPKEVIVWELEDPSGKPIEEVLSIRDQIMKLVRDLVDTLD